MSKAELLSLALKKARTLEPQTQIRLTADVESYTIYNMKGECYIGYMLDKPMPKFFPSHKEYLMIDKAGKEVAKLQKLIL
jgi:hypothetical protein